MEGWPTFYGETRGSQIVLPWSQLFSHWKERLQVVENVRNCSEAVFCQLENWNESNSQPWETQHLQHLFATLLKWTQKLRWVFCFQSCTTSSRESQLSFHHEANKNLSSELECLAALCRAQLHPYLGVEPAGRRCAITGKSCGERKNFRKNFYGNRSIAVSCSQNSFNLQTGSKFFIRKRCTTFKMNANTFLGGSLSILLYSCTVQRICAENLSLSTRLIGIFIEQRVLNLAADHAVMWNVSNRCFWSLITCKNYFLRWTGFVALAPLKSHLWVFVQREKPFFETERVLRVSCEASCDWNSLFEQKKCFMRRVQTLPRFSLKQK